MHVLTTVLLALTMIKMAFVTDGKTRINTANGNDATHRYVTCPTNAGPTAMDAACPTANKSIKYNLCIQMPLQVSGARPTVR